MAQACLDARGRSMLADMRRLPLRAGPAAVWRCLPPSRRPRQDPVRLGAWATGARRCIFAHCDWMATGRPGIWSRSSYSIVPFETGEQMIVDLDSWEAGYADGLLGRPSQRLPALDWFSYSSGYLQARASRAGTRADSRRRATRPSTQRAPRPHGGSSRLIII